MIPKADPNSYTEDQLNRELDRTKAAVFMAKDAVFFGSIMCSLNFEWTRSIESACTNGIYLQWNPDFFMALTKETRITVLKHELWHVARMHMLRVGSRRMKEFNWACVAQGTPIAMADGSEKAVETIESGDLIANINNGTSTVGLKINSGAKDIYEIVLESGRILRCSADHEVLTDEGFRRADSLKEGTSCLLDIRYGKNT